MLRYFTLEYWVDEGWYVGRLKEVPGVFSQGESLEELEENIREAYRLMLEEEEISQLRLLTKLQIYLSENLQRLPQFFLA
ncbi:MAG: type II toxin-antitoxin system HicB family antitoxin [Thermodesulfobacteriota bacterium]